MSDHYPIVIQQLSAEDGGGFMAFVPDLPGCLSDGETEAEALQNVSGAIQDWIDEAVRLKRSVPRPFSARDEFHREQNELHEYIGKLMDVADRQAKALQEQSKTVDELNGELEALRSAFSDAVEPFDCTNQNLRRWRVGLHSFSGCLGEVSPLEEALAIAQGPMSIPH